MFRMFPITTTNTTSTNNTRNHVNLPNLQYTRKVYTLSQIYNTKGSSCSSCGNK